ncbi:uncharacterized protein L203_106094 [Cryptococcus depauperatus CBS 7841]|uniref:Uncharacterized protein n=1 Tax=Cryptococcus depauperatus CBS 7841 TaxID=1295531 RepID=A0A1E3IV77_9TREE|nr:hypothetical protein L203_00801 [Cryptococcus depauperatus CBS 7841]
MAQHPKHHLKQSSGKTLQHEATSQNHSSTRDLSHIASRREHTRTPSADHLMVPGRADTKPERRRQESLDLHRERLQQTTPVTGPATHSARPERHHRSRQLSSTEVVYPTPEAAQAAFRAERAANPGHRKVPQPHTSRRNRDREVRSVQRSDSKSSIRSRVSFDSTRSRGSQRTLYSDLGYESDGYSSGPEGSFVPTSIGPSGEPIQYIDDELGRKEPLHRKVSSKMLKPAMKRRKSRGTTSSGSHGTVTGAKPLPPRPASSYLGSVVNTFSGIASSAARLPTRSQSRSRSRHASHEPFAGETSTNASVLDFQPSSNIPTPRPHSHTRNSSHSIGNLNGMFDRLTMSDMRAPSSLASSRRPQIAPADDLYDYLRIAIVPSWDRWPGQGGSKGSMWGFGLGGRAKGWEDMCYEWHRRAEEADKLKSMRRLVSWEKNRFFEREVLDFQRENIPVYPIDMANRWGTQIFALGADGYATLEFYDDNLGISEDNGLSSWLTGTIFPTVMSALHMVRYSSQNYAFKLITSPRPPHLPPAPAGRRSRHFFWDGFGTLVSVNTQTDTDRSMVVEVRPPSVLDSSVIKEFARSQGSDGWWAFDREVWVGDVGQANLLQAQVHDCCQQNRVHFFTVTNIKYWVFGRFNDDYTACSVSPVIERKSRDPSLLQCLTTWLIQSFDHRLRTNDPAINPPAYSNNYAHDAQSTDEAPPYTEGRRRRRKRQTIPNSTYDVYPPTPPQFQPGSFHQPGMNMMSPGYYDLPPGPGQMHSSPAPGAYPQPGFGAGWGGQNAFTNNSGMPYQNNGMSWYNGGVYTWPGMR